MSKQGVCATIKGDLSSVRLLISPTSCEGSVNSVLVREHSRNNLLRNGKQLREILNSIREIVFVVTVIQEYLFIIGTH